MFSLSGFPAGKRLPLHRWHRRICPQPWRPRPLSYTSKGSHLESFCIWICTCIWYLYLVIVLYLTHHKVLIRNLFVFVFGTCPHLMGIDITVLSIVLSFKWKLDSFFLGGCNVYWYLANTRSFLVLSRLNVLIHCYWVWLVFMGIHLPLDFWRSLVLCKYVILSYRSFNLKPFAQVVKCHRYQACRTYPSKKFDRLT